MSTVVLLSEGILFLLFLLSVFILWKEPNTKNKFLFLNFAIVFFFSVFEHLYKFIGPNGSLFVTERYAGFYYYQYVDRIGFYFFLSLAIVYAVIDSLFRDFKIYQKYAFTILIVGGFAIAYYHPYFQDPKYLYTTEDILDWKAVDKAHDTYVAEHPGTPPPSGRELAPLVDLYAWKDGVAMGVLYHDRKVDRIDELLPYLEGKNYLALLLRPMHWNVIKMNVICMFFLFLFFGYQYRRDPPQGAYVDKIMFMFLLFCSMEILHAFAFIKAVELETMAEIFSAGQYVTIAILLSMVLFFSLRLRFITSVKGEFYEHELVHSAEHITRWRDWVDNLVIHHFLNPKALRGRFLALWAEPSKKELANTTR